MRAALARALAFLPGQLLDDRPVVADRDCPGLAGARTRAEVRPAAARPGGRNDLDRLPAVGRLAPGGKYCVAAAAMDHVQPFDLVAGEPGGRRLHGSGEAIDLEPAVS